MTTTPNLPPLPESAPSRYDSWGRPMPIYLSDQTHAYALAAYQAGRESGLEEAARVPRAYAEELDKGIFGKRFPEELTHIFNASTNMAERIRAIKSDSKEKKNG